jgi:hypothetical protein
MKQLQQAIAELIAGLDARGPRAAPVEQITLEHLRHLAHFVVLDPQASELHRAVMRLKAFWAASIDWCSALSRQVERILIIYEDLLQAAGTAAPEADNRE